MVSTWWVVNFVPLRYKPLRNCRGGMNKDDSTEDRLFPFKSSILTASFHLFQLRWKVLLREKELWSTTTDESNASSILPWPGLRHLQQTSQLNWGQSIEHSWRNLSEHQSFLHLAAFSFILSVNVEVLQHNPEPAVLLLVVVAQNLFPSNSSAFLMLYFSTLRAILIPEDPQLRGLGFGPHCQAGRPSGAAWLWCGQTPFL